MSEQEYKTWSIDALEAVVELERVGKVIETDCPEWNVSEDARERLLSEVDEYLNQRPVFTSMLADEDNDEAENIMPGLERIIKDKALKYGAYGLLVRLYKGDEEGSRLLGIEMAYKISYESYDSARDLLQAIKEEYRSIEYPSMKDHPPPQGQQFDMWSVDDLQVLIEVNEFAHKIGKAFDSDGPVAASRCIEEYVYKRKQYIDELTKKINSSYNQDLVTLIKETDEKCAEMALYVGNFYIAAEMFYYDTENCRKIGRKLRELIEKGDYDSAKNLLETFKEKDFETLEMPARCRKKMKDQTSKVNNDE